tara:strand:+ start:2320 stop:2487 length:168 start_codon:yes stop_codon:yes gene_type:complete
MSDTTQTVDLVNLLAKGDNVNAGEAFTSLMGDAVSAALDAKKIEVASKMYSAGEE